MEQMALKAVGLNKSFGTKEVLKNLELTIEPGRIYGLIGRNGAGKTTLLALLTAQLAADGGQITCGGQPVWENPAALQQLCFSREFSGAPNSVAAGLKVKDYFRIASIYYKNWDDDYAHRLAQRFGLEENKRINKLSKGMLSMVTIVVALASRAPITLLDEPVAGLDVMARELFYKLLLEDYADTGRTFVVSTHIIEEAAAVFEEVIILDEGRIVEKAPTEELVAQFHLISGREDEVDAAAQGLTVLSTERMGRHKAVTVRCGENELAQAVSGRDVDVTPLNLQKVFVALCGHGEVQDG